MRKEVAARGRLEFFLEAVKKRVFEAEIQILICASKISDRNCELWLELKVLA